MLESLRLLLSSGGRIILQEREGDGPSYKSSIVLIEDDEAVEIKVSLGSNQDAEDGDRSLAMLNVYKYHIEDKESGRAFHVDVEVCLDKADLQRLRAMADMLLAEFERD